MGAGLRSPLWKREENPGMAAADECPAVALRFSSAIIPVMGRVAQLGECLVRIQEVRGSSPLTSTRRA